ncbi:hypothetical protein [Nocardioides sp. T2.26MG-1]|uniref:hypothetical protein n=1 Tax=Nocardioides sp. T2.26MG-1 TaxID=3041166 RepID=UPI00247787EC|nr:hypothetical protein [Nocardioides sp. T2.26MG-1]CAI9403101.1 hypothetical protein HIDPHFAB_00951 [Nocardioides sp. T2.26MG-1]
MTKHSMSSRRRAPRQSAALVLSVLLAAGGVTATALSAVDAHTRAGSLAQITSADCGAELVIPAANPGDPVSCAHADQAPPGVDVDKHVPTAVLEARTGAAAAAVEAAQDEGVPVAAQVAAVSDRVPCDGDGTSGYRVQAIYVVTSDRTNRFAAVGDQIKQWASGVSTVFNLSAAKTGGVRDVRFVTVANGDGTCSPSVLNVTLPPGSFTSFGSTITAMRNAGYTAPNRKYLMWVDGTGQCGIAQTYLSSGAGQDNPNNGSYAQFARIDTACWGGSQSVEAHELSHTMGSVQGDAPHATAAGHCYDESDRMCYADGGGKAMQQICSPDQETLFDCNGDDYYSTYPPAGSYLANHWNTANSRFLIGGGDGVGGGSLGTPTVLGGIVSVNNPAVPGLPTQVSATLEIPSGRTASITWSTSRGDCAFTDRTALQTEVVCGARSTTAGTVTATVVDNTGAKLVRTSALTFSSTPRTATTSVTVDGSAAAYVACPTGKAALTAQVVDQASGKPVKGLAVAWFRQVGTGTPAQVATGTTGQTGVATALVTASAGAYSVRTAAAPTFPATTSTAVAVSVASGPCTTQVSSVVDRTSVQAGAPVVVSGVLSRTLPDGSTKGPAAGERVSIYGRAGTATTWSVVGSATTGVDGSYSVVVKPLTSTVLQARFVGRVGMGSSTAANAPITVSPWTTSVTVSPSATDLMAGAAVTVTGMLRQSDGTTATAMASTPVTITYPLAGGRTATASAATNASGAYSVILRPTGSGDVVVRYAGRLGWTASSATVALVVHPWTTSVAVGTSATDLMASSPITVTGSVRQSDGTTATAMASTPVTITYPLAGGRTATASAATNASGAYSVILRPTGSGDVVVRYAGKPGWAAASATQAIVVHPWSTALTLSAVRDPATGYVTATGTLTQISSTGVASPRAGAVVTITYPSSATYVASTRATTSVSGTFVARFRPGVTGAVGARYAGVPGWAEATATPVTVTVP